MIQKIATTIIIIFFINNSFTQKSVISGYVKDVQTGEYLAYASVYDSLTGEGTVANNYGFYSLNLREGNVVLKAEMASYQAFSKNIFLTGNVSIEIEMAIFESQSVVIKDDKNISEQSQMSIIRIPVERLKAIPSIGGERDILKALALTPGVSIGAEGTSGLLVRGGSPDQNLMLLDGATVYNASHLFGFLSVFNPDALKSVELYKGAFPARFGGRLSSVIDIMMKEGNKVSPKTEWNLGLISSRFLTEGPLFKKKGSYLFTARSSYLGLVLLPFSTKKVGNSINYWLYDINGKINYQWKNKNQLFFSIYTGNDFWRTKEKYTKDDYEKTRLDWGNQTASLRYNRIITPKLFAKALATYSRYTYNINSESHSITVRQNQPTVYNTTSHLQSYIQDWTLKTQIDYTPSPRHEIKAGTEAIYHTYRPSAYEANSTDGIDSVPPLPAPIHAQEYAVFAEDNIHFTTWLSSNIGMRAVAFRVIDTTYKALEPRASLHIQLPYQIALNASYSKMRQYIHLLSNNGVGLPNDIWVPATRKVAPQNAQQIAIGLTKFWKKYDTEISIEAYQKEMNNLIDYQLGTNFLSSFNGNWQDIIVKKGTGKATGIETFIYKKQGKWNGWLSYTLAWNKRQFEAINNGLPYYAKYDRRHNVAFTGSYALTDEWNVGLTWVYTSGSPVTLPVAIQQSLQGQEVFVYEGRNNRRMPAYHRLDIGFERKFETQNGHTATFSFGLYNAYNRKNPFYLAVLRPSQTGTTQSNFTYNVVQKSLFPILPYISYGVKF